MEEENCRLGRKRHNPVSSIHVRASSSVSVPCPFRRILSARDASNCSAVKEKPHFQAGDRAFSGILQVHLSSCLAVAPEGRVDLTLRLTLTQSLKMLCAGLPSLLRAMGRHLPMSF